jgi:hypothetical protein
VAIGKNTIPQSKPDKNGRMTTVYINPDKGSDSKRSKGVSTPPSRTTSLIPTIADTSAAGSEDRRIYNAAQRAEHFPRAFYAALVSHRAMKYSKDISAIELEVWGNPVYAGTEKEANEIAARLRNDGVESVVVYDGSGGYQLAQRFAAQVGLEAKPEDISNAYLWIEDEMDKWGARLNEEVNHYRTALRNEPTKF